MNSLLYFHYDIHSNINSPYTVPTFIVSFLFYFQCIMLQRRNKIFEKYTLVSDKHKQFRSWRAWTFIAFVTSIIVFFATNDWRWQLGASLFSLYFGYQTYISYNKWKVVQKDIEKSTRLSSSLSQELGVEKPTAGVFPVAASLSMQKNLSPARSAFDQQQTPSNIASIRRRLPRGQIESIQSSDNNPENFSPELAKKFARQAMQSPDKLSTMTTSKSSLNNANRFPIIPTTPSMDQPGLQGRKPYHVSPLVTDSVRRNVSSAEPRRVDALQALGIGSIPDEWIENLKENLGSHLYAVLKLHDQSVQVIKSFLKQQQEQGNIPVDSMAKICPILNHEVTYKSVTLTDGTTLTVDSILQFCAQPIAPPAPAMHNYQFNVVRSALQPGVSKDILQKYKAAWSFFKLCRHIQEIIQQRPFPESAGAVLNSDNNMLAMGMPFVDPLSSDIAPSSSSSHKTTLIERLRQLQSSDRKLRIEWQSMSFSRGGFGFGGGRNIRDFISGHQEYEMMDQDIVLALFLHRCDEHQSRIITASASQPQKFSDMHFVTQIEDVRQLLQHHHQEMASAFDGSSSRTSELRGGARRISGASENATAPAFRDAGVAPSSQLLNIFLRNYPQPVEGDGAAGGSLSGGTTFNASNATATAGRRVSPHYDLLRLAAHVTHPSQMIAQQSWQQMSSMLASLSSSIGSGVSTPLFLSWFPQYKEILTIESGRNDVFEAIIVLIIIMTLTAPANELEEGTARGVSGSNSNNVNVDGSDVVSTTSDESTHHNYHHHHHNALHRIMSLLAGNKEAMMGSEDRSTVMMKLRRVFKLKGMGSGAANHARVVRSLFDEVVDVHELRHLMYDFHSLQQLQQQQSQQQQQILAQSSLSSSGKFSPAVASAPISSTPMMSTAYSPLNPNSASGKSLGSLSSDRLYNGNASIITNTPLLLLDGYGSSGMTISSGGLFDSHRKSSSNQNTNWSTPFRNNVGGGATPAMWSGQSPTVTGGPSPLYSPPLYGVGLRINSNVLNFSMKSPGVGSTSALMTPVALREGLGMGGLGGGGGSALRGFNSSFSTDMSSYSSMLHTAEKSRQTPFMMS